MPLKLWNSLVAKTRMIYCMIISIKTTHNNSSTIENVVEFCGYLIFFTLDVTKIVENPPNVLFIGKQLTYKTLVTGSRVHPKLKHHRIIKTASYPTDLCSMNKSSVKFQSHNKDLPPPG